MIASLLLRTRLPEKVKVAVVAVLLGVFAKTFDVKPPRVASLSHRAALDAFREFSAACMEAAIVSPDYAAQKRAELAAAASSLGGRMRGLLKPRDNELSALVSFLYDAIEIEVDGTVPGRLLFKRCFFSERYTPEFCAFMSAFDGGFVSGLCGGGLLVFESRITEGASCCTALLMQEG